MGVYSIHNFQMINSHYTQGMWAYQLNCTDYQNLIDMGWRRLV